MLATEKVEEDKVEEEEEERCQDSWTRSKRNSSNRGDSMSMKGMAAVVLLLLSSSWIFQIFHFIARALTLESRCRC